MWPDSMSIPLRKSGIWGDVYYILCQMLYNFGLED